MLCLKKFGFMKYAIFMVSAIKPKTISYFKITFIQTNTLVTRYNLTPFLAQGRLRLSI